jgi:hypothetical protein
MRFVPHHKPGARRYDLFMANFIGKIMAKVVGGLDALRVKQTSLVSQRDAAEVSLAKARTALQVYLLSDNDGDDRAVAALQTKVDSAASLLASLDTAIKTQGERVADAERQKADEQNQAARKAASEAIAADVAKIESQIAPWLASTRKLATDLDKYGSFRFEAGGIAKYLANAAVEIELALSVSIPDLKSGVIAVLEGRERIPEQPATVTKLAAPAPAPTTELLFLTHSLGWFDAEGRKYRAPAMHDANLPLQLVGKARQLGAAHDLNSDVRRKNHGSKTSAPPEWAHCKFLNDDPKAKTDVEPIVHSAFERHPNVRPAYSGTMRQPQTGTATRSLPPGKK